jgi:hypothetical protein
MSDYVAKFPLDAIQLAALRKATTVSFHNHADDRPNTLGRSYIRASKAHDRTAADPFAPRETSIEMQCQATVHDYEKPNTWKPDFEAFAWVSSARIEEAWQTIASLLRVGDDLTLAWEAGALSSPFLVDKGLIGDRVRLVVQRGKTRLVFALDEQIGESRYRMVKVARAKEYAITG